MTIRKIMFYQILILVYVTLILLGCNKKVEKSQTKVKETIKNKENVASTEKVDDNLEVAETINTNKDMKTMISTYDNDSIFFKAGKKTLGSIRNMEDEIGKPSCEVGRGNIDCSIEKVSYLDTTTVYLVHFSEWKYDGDPNEKKTLYKCVVANSEIISAHPSKKIFIKCKKK